jgi:hypothetical protein
MRVVVMAVDHAHDQGEQQDRSKVENTRLHAAQPHTLARLLSRFSSHSTASPESPAHLGTRHISERRETPRSDLGAERLEDLGGVAVGLDVVPGPLDMTLLVDQEGRPQHPDAGLENDCN